jgi:hypothetical protein
MFIPDDYGWGMDMALKYDFDIFEVIPSSAGQDPQLDGLLAQFADQSRDEQTFVALFRDSRTAEALRNAPDLLRDYFIASGFGLNTFDSGAPEGRYPASDEQARLAIIGKLAENASTFPLPAPDAYPEGGDVFRLGEFLLALDESEPLSGDDQANEQLNRRFGGAVPAIFETDPLREDEPELTVVPPSSSTQPVFWQSWLVQIIVASGLGFAAMQLADGPAMIVLAGM